MFSLLCACLQIKSSQQKLTARFQDDNRKYSLVKIRSNYSKRRSNVGEPYRINQPSRHVNEKEIRPFVIEELQDYRVLKVKFKNIDEQAEFGVVFQLRVLMYVFVDLVKVVKCLISQLLL